MNHKLTIVELGPREAIELTIVSLFEGQRLRSTIPLQGFADEQAQQGYITVNRMTRHNEPFEEKYVFQHVMFSNEGSRMVGQPHIWMWDGMAECFYPRPS